MFSQGEEKIILDHFKGGENFGETPITLYFALISFFPSKGEYQ
jgi:hypothetical protein